MARISGNDKLFRLDLASGNKTQLTFGTHDEAAAQFMDANTLVFPSTAVDPGSAGGPGSRQERRRSSISGRST